MSRQAATTDKENSQGANSNILSNIFKPSKATREASAAAGHHRPLAELQSSQEEIHVHTGQRRSPIKTPASVSSDTDGRHEKLGLKTSSSCLLTKSGQQDLPSYTESSAGHRLSRPSSFSTAAAASTAAASENQQQLAASKRAPARTSPHAQHDHSGSSDLSDVEVPVASQASRSHSLQVSLWHT